MVKLERNTRTVAIITVLIVLIIVRLLTTDTGGTKWIELINIAGLLIAIFALLNDVYLECKEYEKNTSRYWYNILYVDHCLYNRHVNFH